MEKRFYVKEHVVGNTRIVGACDMELLGKTIHDETGLKINVTEKFYGGVLVDEKELLRLIEKANSVNLVGNKVVRVVLERGLGGLGNVKEIGGVMLMMIIRL
ncbi:MAG: DUF424 family protein [Candidatus Brockarchaeota archaeon]|nr:DUF424 family protein [Candidatus Brockarchaeota archaeon]